MARYVDDRILDFLKERKATTPEAQRTLNEISEATGQDIQNVRAALKRLKDSGEVEVSTRHIDNPYPGPHIQVNKDLREEHNKMLGSTYAWLGPVTIAAMKEDERIRKERELLERQTEALERIARHTQDRPAIEYHQHGDVTLGPNSPIQKSTGANSPIYGRSSVLSDSANQRQKSSAATIAKKIVVVLTILASIAAVLSFALDLWRNAHGK